MVELCVVCSMDMTPWSVTDREIHLNVCLDRTMDEQFYECPTCGQDLSHCDERQRLEHVNICLDRAVAVNNDTQSDGKEREEEEEEYELLPTQVVEQTQVQREEEEAEDKCSYVCKICGADMAEIDLIRRIRHVKLCGQKFGVRVADMAEVEKAETITARLEEKNAPDAFAIMMNSSMKELKAQTAGIGTCVKPKDASNLHTD